METGCSKLAPGKWHSFWKTLPGKSRYKDATERDELHDRKTFSDNMPKRKDERNSIDALNLLREDFFQGQNSKQLPSYVVVNLESSNYNTVKFHVGISDV